MIGQMWTSDRKKHCSLTEYIEDIDRQLKEFKDMHGCPSEKEVEIICMGEMEIEGLRRLQKDLKGRALEIIGNVIAAIL
ncbi:MAG: hypothetical protein LBT18_03795 [Endomicrobium sp.]|jgi:hypothetical protein|nr:hypothetical protein [Endomicrobium sp.]